MTRHDILARAGDEHGPVVTLAKAAAIVASGGRATTCAVDMEGINVWGMWAKVSCDSSWQVHGPLVTWASLVTNTPEDALLHAAVVKAAAQIGLAARDAVNCFATVPPWVHAELEDLTYKDGEVCGKAAHRYHAGDVDVTQAWYHARDDMHVARKLGAVRAAPAGEKG